MDIQTPTPEQFYQIACVAVGALPKPATDALFQFTTDDELLRSEGPEDEITADLLMKLGLVSQVKANGYMFIQLMPLGILLRNTVTPHGSFGG